MPRLTVRCLLCTLIALAVVGITISLGMSFQLQLKRHEPSAAVWHTTLPSASTIIVLPPPSPRQPIGSRVPAASPSALSQKKQPTLQPAHCEHTRQGATLVVDEYGYLCVRAAFDTRSGCCIRARAHLYTCRRCNATLHCCPLYEECVSCCMRFAHEGGGGGRALDAFAQCQRTCRTASWSLDVKQAYLDAEMPYCYERHARTPADRTQHDVEQHAEDDHRQHEAELAAERPLVAPSPPPTDDDDRLLEWMAVKQR